MQVQAPAAALGELLRWHRQRRGLTQGELAARGAPELSVNTVGNLERGRTRPYRHTLETLCTALGLDEPERGAVFAAWRAGARTAGPGPPLQATAEAASAPPPPAAGAPGALGPGRFGRFPASPAPLVGREAEIRQICEHLSGRGSRLLTLTGPGGVGKTRLALAVAERLLGNLPDGGYFVDLSPIGEAALVLPALARAVGAWDPGEPASPARVRARLGTRQVLLVLDNFEHVLPAAAPLAALLDACPRVRTLVTSREPLRLRREQQFPVPPLGLADARGALTPGAVAAAPAAQLYVRRAQAVQPSFALTAANARAVAELCARLDGLPLAIELAAARVKVLPPAAILARLEGRLDLLASKGADEPARHRTLRTAIEWSYDLLEPGERALFRRLAVFAGACTLEAVEAVCAEPPTSPGGAAARGRRRGRRGRRRVPAPSPGLPVLTGLESLVDKSLLQQEEAAGEPRLRMLETVRAYAQERLSAAGETEPLARRHLAYCVQRAEQAVPHLLGAEQPRWLEYLGHEYDDLRAALGRAVAAGAAAPALRLAAALWRFWYFRSDFAEGRWWLTRVLALPAAAAPASARAEALNGAGALAISQDDFAAARGLYEECLALRRGAGDRSGEARALNNLSVVAVAVADYPRAQALLEASLALHREVGYRIGEAYNLNNLGLLRRGEGALAAARARQEESLALFEELGDVWGAAMAQCDLADVLRDQGAAESAARLYAASLARRRAVGDRRGAGVTLAGLARLETRRGRYAEARANLAAALAIAREVRDGRAAARVLETGAELAAAEARPDHALRLAAAAAAVRARAGVPLPLSERAPWEAWLRTVRGTVGGAEAVRVWTAGGTAPLDQILTEALLCCSERPPGAGAMDAPGEAVTGGWSAA